MNNIYPCLDEDITIDLTFSPVIPKDGTYDFKVQDRVGKVIFNGNVFLRKNTNSVSIPINDIIENYVFNGNCLVKPLHTEAFNHHAIETFSGTIGIPASGDTPARSVGRGVTVHLAYKYPNFKSKMGCAMNPNHYYDKKILGNLLQGSNAYELPGTIPSWQEKYNGLYFAPRVPLINTNQYGIGFSYHVLPDSSTANTVTVSAELAGEISDTGTTHTYICPSSINYINLSEMFGHQVYYTNLMKVPTISPNLWHQHATVPVKYSTDVSTQSPNSYVKVSFCGNHEKQFSLDSTPTTIKYTFKMNVFDVSQTDKYVQFEGVDGLSGNNIKFKVASTTTTTFAKNRRYTIMFTGSFSNSTGKIYVYDFKFYMGDVQDDTGLYINGLLACKVDINPCTRYYLSWVDRMTGIQSQPFCAIDTFSEDFTYSTAVSYNNKKRNANVTVKPKWKIQTNWIDEMYYPFYESIFTSPQLLLYDLQEDKSYNVIVSDKSYTEKTYENNSHKFFNLTLNLEENKNQILRY